MKYDEIHYWSEVKLDIVREYASAYSRILSAQKNPFLSHIYIDAFAGAGRHISKKTGEYILGSPLNALNIVPPFLEYYLIDLDGEKVQSLREMTKERENVYIEEGDCNDLLLKKVFPRAHYEDYRRALCLLDPYRLNLDWKAIYTAGSMKSIEIFLNFSVLSMNRGILWHDTNKVGKSQRERMNRFWGDDSWRHIVYSTEGNLFGWEEKQGNEVISKAFQARLKKVAGFKCVPDPIPMRNSKGAIVYYLFFASQKPVAMEIVKEIFDKYKNRGIQ
jgi:three-Cys-motif partner protein